MSSKAKLTRQIGLLPLIIYYFSTIVGVGVFLVPLQAARIAGPASIVSWLLVLLMIYPFAMIFAHISQVYQVSGSIQKFIEDSAGFKFGKSMALFMTITAMFGNSLLGYTAARYVMELIGYTNNQDFAIVLGLGIISLSCCFNLMNLALSSKIQTITLIALITVLGFAVGGSIPSYEISNITPFMPNGVGSIFAAMLICFYSVVGWENVDAIAEEVQEPVKTYKKAIRISLLAIALCYISIALAVVFVIPPEQIGESNTIITLLLTNSLGEHSGQVGSLLAIILLFLGANVWVLGTSRIIFALARDKVLPEFLASVNKNHIPVMAVFSQLIVYAIISGLMIIIKVKEDAILELASLNYLLLYIVIFFCGVIKFTTMRLKVLSGVSIIISVSLLLHSTNNILSISLMVGVLCFAYIYIFKRRLRH